MIGTMGLLPGTIGGMPLEMGRRIRQRNQLEGLLGDPMLNAGIGLLSASGPSTTPVSFGQAMGAGLQGLQNAQGFRDSRQDRDYRNRDIDSRIDERGARSKFFKAQSERMSKPQGYQPSAQYRQLIEAGYQPGTPEWKQAFNQLLKMGPKDRSVLKDANGRQRYEDTGELVFPEANVVAKPEKAPTGYRWSENGSLDAIPGGPADKEKTLSGESAGRYAAVQQAMQQDMPVIERLAFTEQGEVADSHLWPGMPWAANSKLLRDAMRRTINAVLRMESGAVVSESEIEEAMEMYMPGHLDSLEAAQRKIGALRARGMNAMRAIDGGVRIGEKENLDPLGIR